jgi:hypothetical protein
MSTLIKNDKRALHTGTYYRKIYSGGRAGYQRRKMDKIHRVEIRITTRFKNSLLRDAKQRRKPLSEYIVFVLRNRVRCAVFDGRKRDGREMPE